MYFILVQRATTVPGPIQKLVADSKQSFDELGCPFVFGIAMPELAPSAVPIRRRGKKKNIRLEINGKASALRIIGFK